MDIGMVSSFVSWLLQVDPACIACNWDPVTQSWIPAAGAGAAAGTGLGLNDLFQGTSDGGFGETPGGGVGDTTNPNYSNTSTEDTIAADQEEQQRINDYYRSTHPGATTAGPTGPSTNEQAVDFFHRALVKRIQGK